MAVKINKKCCVCGNDYTIFCPSCREAVNQPTWMNSFCSENCKQIYEATAGYFGKAYSAQEAKTLLDMCDLSNKENFTAATQRLINEIYEAVGVEEKEVATTLSSKTEEEVKHVNVQHTKAFNKKKK